MHTYQPQSFKALALEPQSLVSHAFHHSSSCADLANLFNVSKFYFLIYKLRIIISTPQSYEKMHEKIPGAMPDPYK